MSKFENVSVTSGKNQFGDNNTQNNTENHHHHHHHNGNGKGSGEEEIIPVAIGAVAGLAALIWWFFNHIDQVYYYLNIITLSSATLSALALFIIISSGAIAKEDLFRVLGSVIFAVGLFGLAMLSRDHAPNEVIQLSHQTKFMDFWQSLTDHGKDLVISNFIAAIVIGMSGIIAHLTSLRQFSYSLAKPNRSGFWYGIYRAMGAFKMRVSMPLITILSGLAWAASAGKLPGINA